MALAFIIYGLWFIVTFFYRDLPWWGLAALGAWIVAWQLNLQHETIHGHPTRNRRVNEMIGCWPLSLWLPYSIYRSTHLAHHRDENLTDPFEDPESYYWTVAGWGGLGSDRGGRSPMRGRRCSGASSFGPGLSDRRASSAISCATRGAASAARARILAAPPHPVRAGADLGDRDLPHAALDLLRLLRLSRREPRDGALVRRASRRCRRRSGARRSSRTPGFWGRCSCSTTCMWPITCATACPGTSCRNSIGSTGRR